MARRAAACPGVKELSEEECLELDRQLALEKQRLEEESTDGTPKPRPDTGPKLHSRRWRWWGLFAGGAILWLLLLRVAVRAEFGLVFVIVSGFGAIALNLNYGPRKPGSLSAWSVFNEGAGTFHTESS